MCAAVGSTGGVAFDVFPVINTLGFFPPLCCTGATGATGAGGGVSGLTSFSGGGGDSIPGGGALLLLVLTTVFCFSSCFSCSGSTTVIPGTVPTRTATLVVFVIDVSRFRVFYFEPTDCLYKERKRKKKKGQNTKHITTNNNDALPALSYPWGMAVNSQTKSSCTWPSCPSLFAQT